MNAVFVSLLSVDPTALGDAADRLAAADVDGLHLDIADGAFVPYLTFGPAVVRGLRRRLPGARLDVHLMVERPESYLEELAAGGADRVTFHVEATRYPWRVLTLARAAGIPRIGVGVNPSTPIEALDSVAHAADFVNMLTTEPDVAGEGLLPTAVERVRAVRARLGPEAVLLADGGVTCENIAALAAAGADEFVVGRAITSGTDWAAALRGVREVLP